jgi:hypothetical protein
METSSPNEQIWSNTFHSTLGVRTEKKTTNAKHTTGCTFSSSSTLNILQSGKNHSNLAVLPPRRRAVSQTTMTQPQTSTPQHKQQGDMTTNAMQMTDGNADDGQ